MTKETIKKATGILAGSKLLTDDAWQELVDFLYTHPVMLDGKEEKGWQHYDPVNNFMWRGMGSSPFSTDKIPVDDEQPEHRGMPLFPTPYSDTDIHPRSAPPNEPGAPDSVTQLNV